MKSATRILISTFGGLVGLMGIEHGIGEVLQGNAAPEGLMILSWPGSDFFRILGGEPAMTILPSMLVTGILAILFSLIYLVWAIWFADRRRGGLVLILLSAPMLLFGGGIFPPVFGLLMGAAATRIGRPPVDMRKRLSPGVLRLLEQLWPWAFVTCVLSWLGMFPGVPVLSYFWGYNDPGLIFLILACMFGSLFLSSLAAFGRDLKTQVG